MANFTDKDLMENLLALTKGACGLFLHGTIESANHRNQDTFQDILVTTLGKQAEIYNIMVENGWYQKEQVEACKITKLINKQQGQ